MRVKICDSGQIVHLSPELTLLEGLLSEGIELDNSCGGFGTCGTCRIYVAHGALAGREDVEQERAEERGFAENERLACQIKPVEGLEIYLTKKGLP